MGGEMEEKRTFLNKSHKASISTLLIKEEVGME